MALYADHGVVHVRDTAQQILQVLTVINGVSVPARQTGRLEWMKTYGVAVAYVHDIGMIDFSAFGRTMHPEYATQAVLSMEFDDIFDALLRDGGLLTERLTKLAQLGALEQPPHQVLREMLAMANCHSRSKMQVTVLKTSGEYEVFIDQHTANAVYALRHDDDRY